MSLLLGSASSDAWLFSKILFYGWFEANCCQLKRKNLQALGSTYLLVPNESRVVVFHVGISKRIARIQYIFLRMLFGDKIWFLLCRTKACQSSLITFGWLNVLMLVNLQRGLLSHAVGRTKRKVFRIFSCTFHQYCLDLSASRWLN